MKLKISVLLVTVLMIITLAACDSGNKKQEETMASEATVRDETTNAASSDADKKVLVVYFSAANNNTADAVSAATQMVDGKSAVEYIAELIGDETGAEVHKIVPDKAYPLAYRDAADYAKEEQDNDERPTFTLDVNPEDYDVIFVGYPVWWYEIPMIMDTFFDQYDFSGKTIIPFNTHLGSKDGGTYDDIADLEPKAMVLEGFNVSGDSVDDAKEDVSSWIANLDY